MILDVDMFRWQKRKRENYFVLWDRVVQGALSGARGVSGSKNMDCPPRREGGSGQEEAAHELTGSAEHIKAFNSNEVRPSSILAQNPR